MPQRALPPIAFIDAEMEHPVSIATLSNQGLVPTVSRPGSASAVSGRTPAARQKSSLRRPGSSRAGTGSRRTSSASVASSDSRGAGLRRSASAAPTARSGRAGGMASLAQQRPATAGNAVTPNHPTAFSGYPESFEVDMVGASPSREVYENQRLREELQQLKLALVSKMRGSNKFVSGGQFRSNKNRQNTGNVRGQLLKVKAENRTLHAQVAELRAQLRHLEAQYEHAVQERDSGRSAFAQLHEARQALTRSEADRLGAENERGQLQQLLANTKVELQQAEAAASQLAEAMNTLSRTRKLLSEQREAVQRLEAEVESLRMRSPVHRVVSPKPCGHEPQIKGLNAQVTELHDLLSQRNAQLSDMRHDLADGEVKLEEAVASNETLRRRVRDGEAAVSRSAWELTEMGTKLAEAEVAQANAERALAALQAQNSKCRCGELNVQVAQLQKQLAEAKESAKQSAEAARQAELLASAYEARLKADDAQKRLESSSASTALASANAKLQEKEDEIEGLYSELRAAHKATEVLQNKLFALEHEVRVGNDRYLEQQCQARDANAQVAILEARVMASDAEVVQVRKEAAEAVQKAHAEAMEKTLQSMVRLCVVAPTVNVQVGNQGSAVNCKPKLPHDQLRTVIQEQVLPKFVAAFLQSADATAPDGSPLQVWLRKLAGDMQRSIEHHLQQQFSQGSEPAARRGSTSSTRPGSGARARPGSSRAKRPPLPIQAKGSNSGEKKTGGRASMRCSPVELEDDGGANRQRPSTAPSSEASAGMPPTGAGSRSDSEEPDAEALPEFVRRDPRGRRRAGTKNAFVRSKSSKALRAGLQYGRGQPSD